DTWTSTNAGVDAPDARENQLAVWAGTEMIIWGGYTYAGRVDTGGRYNPLTDTWRTTSTKENVPMGLGTAVWTGTEMIAWGGYDRYGIETNTGGRYDPLMDKWTPTSMGQSVPSRRRSHTAMWTGTEMIVWGGRTFD